VCACVPLCANINIYIHRRSTWRNGGTNASEAITGAAAPESGVGTNDSFIALNQHIARAFLPGLAWGEGGERQREIGQRGGLGALVTDLVWPNGVARTDAPIGRGWVFGSERGFVERGGGEWEARAMFGGSVVASRVALFPQIAEAQAEVSGRVERALDHVRHGIHSDVSGIHSDVSSGVPREALEATRLCDADLQIYSLKTRRFYVLFVWTTLLLDPMWVMTPKVIMRRGTLH